MAATNSTSILVGNINGDPILDIVTANSTDRTISVFLGTGTNAFGPHQNFSTLIDSNAVALGDLNGDGKPDAVVGSNTNVSQIAVLLNDGNAGFQAPNLITTSTAAQRVYDLKIADFNADGMADVALVAANNLIFFLGNGQGGLTLNTTIPWVGRFAILAAADLNGDTISDVVVTRADVFENWAFATVLGNSSATFTISAPNQLLAQPNGVQVGSFNGDSTPDIAFSANYDFQPAISDPFYVQIWSGTGNANFTAGPRIGLPRKTAGLAIGDFDLDGNQDLAVNTSSFIAKLNGLGSGAFTSPGFWMSSGSVAIVSVDADQDNRKDVVALRNGAPSTLSVFRTRSDGTFETPRPLLNGGTHIVAADMNSDTFVDLLTATTTESNTPSQIVIARNDQNQGFLPDVSFTTRVSLESFELANINNDGKPDLFTTHSNDSRVDGYLGDGIGGISRLGSSPVTLVNAIDMVVPADFNGDSKQDFLLISAQQGFIYLGNGNGQFGNTFTIGVINPYVRPQVGDFNEDGKIDLAIVAPQQDGLRIYLGVGNGHFNLGTTFPIDGFQSMTKGDFNADGNLDIAGIGGPSTRVTKYFGDGNGGFSGTAQLNIEGRAEAVTAGDFNLDGLDDVAFVSFGQRGSLIVIGSMAQAPYFGPPVYFPAGGLGAQNFENSTALAAADFNNDGKIDIGYTEIGVSRGVVFNTTDINTPCVSIDDVTITETDSSSNAIFTVSLSRTSPNIVSFNYAVRDLTTVTGQDLQNRFGRLEIPTGQTSATITIPVMGDLLDEFDEQFLISLSGVSNGFLLKESGSGTILDNDAQPTLTINDVELTEVATSQQAVFNVTLSAPSGKSIDFRYATANGTATSGSDYASTSIVKTILPGNSSTTFGIQIFTDTMHEPTEDFFVNLSQPANVSILDSQGKVTLHDNDPVPTFTITGGSVTEPDTGFVNRTITIRLSNSTYLPVTGNVQTSDGTAIAGSDYTTFNAPFTFSPGVVQQVAQVRVLGDTIDEPNEVFFVDASSVVNAGIGNSQTQVTIIDNDITTIRSAFDFDGDGKTDPSVYRPSMGDWYLLNTTTGFRALHFGLPSDIMVPADFTGDGKTDMAVWRPSDSIWYVLRSEDNTFYGAGFGANGDVPAPGDYDGDGKADLVVIRPGAQQSYWYLQQSTAGFAVVPFGLAGDVPTLGDYDGDGKNDVAVYRPTAGAWFRFNSSNGSFLGVGFGITGDKVVPADYTGDGKTDLAVFRTSNNIWYILRSEDNSLTGGAFGALGDLPSPGDYDGDGKADLAVYRPGPQSVFYLQQSTAGFNAIPWGLAEDRPVSGAYVY